MFVNPNRVSNNTCRWYATDEYENVWKIGLLHLDMSYVLKKKSDFCQLNASSSDPKTDYPEIEDK